MRPERLSSLMKPSLAGEKVGNGFAICGLWWLEAESRNFLWTEKGLGFQIARWRHGWGSMRARCGHGFIKNHMWPPTKDHW